METPKDQTLYRMCIDYGFPYNGIYNSASRLQMFAIQIDGKYYGIRANFEWAKELMQSGKTFAQACQIIKMEEK